MTNNKNRKEELMKLKNFLIIIILFTFIFSLTGCQNKKNEEEILKEKTDASIRVS